MGAPVWFGWAVSSNWSKAPVVAWVAFHRSSSVGLNCRASPSPAGVTMGRMDIRMPLFQDPGKLKRGVVPSRQGGGARDQVDERTAAVGRRENELLADEVDVDPECSRARRHRAGGHAPAGEGQGDVPPFVEERGQRHLTLPMTGVHRCTVSRVPAHCS